MNESPNPKTVLCATAAVLATALLALAVANHEPREFKSRAAYTMPSSGLRLPPTGPLVGAPTLEIVETIEAANVPLMGSYVEPLKMESALPLYEAPTPKAPD